MSASSSATSTVAANGQSSLGRFGSLVGTPAVQPGAVAGRMRWMFREQLWGWSAGGRASGDGLHRAAGGDLDALGLGLFSLGDQDAQHPVLHRSLDRVGFDLGGQGDPAAEGAGGALDPVELLLGGVMRQVALA